MFGWSTIFSNPLLAATVQLLEQINQIEKLLQQLQQVQNRSPASYPYGYSYSSPNIYSNHVSCVYYFKSTVL